MPVPCAARVPPVSSLEEAARWRDAIEAAGGRLVFTNGCFDLLHAGHVRYLAQARNLGTALLVALNSDSSVRALKGPGRPINSQDDRAEVLRALRSVDAVVTYDEERCTRLLRAIRPHLYAKGGDYTPASLNPEEKEALQDIGAEIHILPLVPGRSTSQTLHQLQSQPPQNKRDGDHSAERASPRRLRLGILGSGRGSNFEAILQSIASGQLDAEVALVLSDVPTARILERARAAGIPAQFVDPGPYRTRLGEPAQKEIRDRLRAAGVDLVILAGFMRKVKDPLLTDYAGRILNIHPSLLPSFPGREAWRQAIAAGARETGTSVHIVGEEIDAGPILAQEKVPIHPDDTPETLLARIQQIEHRLYPEVIASYGAQILAG